MAIEKENLQQTIEEQPLEIEIDESQQEIPQDLEVLIKEIGDLDVDELSMESITFGDNLAESIEEDSLNTLCSSLSDH